MPPAAAKIWVPPAATPPLMVDTVLPTSALYMPNQAQVPSAGRLRAAPTEAEMTLNSPTLSAVEVGRGARAAAG